MNASDPATQIQNTIRDLQRGLESLPDLIAQCLGSSDSHSQGALVGVGEFAGRLLPRWLRVPELTEWRELIQNATLDDARSPSACLLFAALHACSASEQDPDIRSLYDSLREVGKRLYAWLRDGGHDESDSASIATLWASAINSAFVGRVEIAVPVPGHAANSLWMLFKPRGGSSPDVVSVRSWCVNDGQRRPVHRADVTV